jgi:hypothetical protein
MPAVPTAIAQPSRSPLFGEPPAIAITTTPIITHGHTTVDIGDIRGGRLASDSEAVITAGTTVEAITGAGTMAAAIMGAVITAGVTTAAVTTVAVAEVDTDNGLADGCSRVWSRACCGQPACGHREIRISCRTVRWLDW